MWWKAQFQMAVNRTTGQTPRQFLWRKLVKGPNNVLPWSPDFKFRIYFVKLTSKFEKIGLLDDPGGQGSSLKDFICRLDLSNGLELRPRKEKSRFGCFWTSHCSVGLWKSYFFACSPQGFTASRWPKINLIEHFIMVSTLLNHFLLAFLENLFPIKIW
jgi:hypothetical protein